jgi:hypothetical protein
MSGHTPYRTPEPEPLDFAAATAAYQASTAIIAILKRPGASCGHFVRYSGRISPFVGVESPVS